jgi:hypothetical protein
MTSRVLALASLYEPMRFLERRVRNLNACDLSGVLVHWCDCSPEPVWERVREVLRGCRFEHRVDHHPERTTLYWTWNWIIRQSGWPDRTPEYLTNVNADDLHAPSYFAAMSALLDSRPDVMVAAPRWHHTREMDDAWPPRDGEILAPEPGGTMGHFPMWRSAAHREVGLFDPRMVAVGDSRFWGRVLRKRGPGAFAVHPEPLGCYLLHDSNLYHTALSPDGNQSGEGWDVGLDESGVEW